MTSNGGSENRTIELSRLIGNHIPVRVWSDRKVAPELDTRLKIERIRAPLRYPCGGTLVFVGVYFRLKSWLRFARPHRLIALYNTPDLSDLNSFMTDLRSHGITQSVEMVYAAEWLRTAVGVPGPVQASPIDLTRFFPLDRQLVDRPFTVGRLSRDFDDKHHPDDAELWLALAERGIRVRLMGASCLKARLAHRLIETIDAGSELPEQFLRTLDVFLYRTNDRAFFEPWGRVVFEAMASGLPVVCGARGGYREDILDGVNGYLFDGNEAAIQLVELLRADSTRRRRVGAAARQYVSDLFSESRAREQAAFYLAETDQTVTARL